MKIFVPKETKAGETRIALVPAASKLVSLGADLVIEAGLGAALGFSDATFEKVGVKVASDRKSQMASADIILRLHKPSSDEISSFKKGAIHISYLDPFNEKTLVQELAAAHISAFSMELIPRITRAQKMDSLSSQASLGGYAAVILAASKLPKIFPMMMTPAGTISPSRVFVVGAGVAGLQAIATAKRLGARVEAFDTRPAVEEQVKSLGGVFVKIDLGETGEAQGGYAKQLTPEQLAKQREGMKKHCAQADVVITTAQVFGRKAPLIITQEMLEAMKPGSLVVDMAVETGGNVEGSQLGEEVKVGNTLVLGVGNLPGMVPLDASLMYANNVMHFVSEFWDKETKSFKMNLDDEIIKGALVTHNGQIVNAMLQK